MRTFIAALTLLFVAGGGPGEAHAQARSSEATPFPESSAGRAMRRITFAAIDCVKGDATCPEEAFTTSGLFDNGTYQDTRFNYGGNLSQGDVSNSFLPLILTQSQTFPNPSTRAASRSESAAWFRSGRASSRLAGGLLATMYAVVPTGQSGLQVQRPTFNLGLNYAF